MFWITQLSVFNMREFRDRCCRICPSCCSNTEGGPAGEPKCARERQHVAAKANSCTGTHQKLQNKLRAFQFSSDLAQSICSCVTSHAAELNFVWGGITVKSNCRHNKWGFKLVHLQSTPKENELYTEGKN